MSGSIGLAEFIAQVRQELLEQPDGEVTPIFMLDEVQLEVQIVASKDVQGGLNVQVLSLGGKASRTNTHTVRIRMSPILDRDERKVALGASWQSDGAIGDVLTATVKSDERSQEDD